MQLLSVLTLCLAFALTGSLAKPIQKAACTKPSPLPTFNDANYYRSAISASTPAALRSALATITATGFIDLTYACIWTVLEEADQDSRNSSNVMLLYTQESFPKSIRDNGSNEIGWNREHSWPKSHGFPNESDDPYTDAHHLRACDKRVNNRRNDKDFDNGGTAICLLPWGGSTGSSCQVLTYDTSTTFEVPLAERGDVARMVFYLDVRYRTEYGLYVVDESTYRSGEPKLGYLCTLLEWHKQDPVSAFELQRNTIIWYYQGNRNPFIDHPEWVEDIWASSC